MPITASNVKLVASEVMLDTPEAGGAPSANVIADGVSNSIFPDISELDRAGGRVNLRKVFASVQTEDTDSYFGANVIVAEPPEDPRVSVTLFATDDFFDERENATSRIESYLARGGEWGGYLWENHIVGQRVVQLLQRPEEALPNVGQTLVLIQDEDTPAEKSQYVRITSVSAISRRFFHPGTNSDYIASVVSLGISDALRFDFRGSPADRSFTRAPSGSKVRDTVVADAGMYAGVVPLTAPAQVGDFAIQTSSIFTQLVPSAQTETPINDVRANGVSSALVATGGVISKPLARPVAGSNVFSGSPILPGSIDLSGVTDSGGVLVFAGSQVGSVNYESGILSFSVSVWGQSPGSGTLRFTPAETPSLISEQASVRVTAESRSLNYAITLNNPPAPKTVSVSYLAQGRWYVLRDNGAGALRGSDAAFGAGTVSFSTGSLVFTLGSLPDVGSTILINSFSPESTVAPTNSSLRFGGRPYVPINTAGQISEEKGPKPITPTGFTVTWSWGPRNFSATDDGLGKITGDAKGVVDYAQGVAYLCPTIIPPAGTSFSVDFDVANPSAGVGVSVVNGLIGATNISPRSVSFTANAKVRYKTSRSWLPFAFSERSIQVRVYDTGGGTLVFEDPVSGAPVQCGTVNYSTGALNVQTADLPVQTSDPAGPNHLYGNSWNSYTTYYGQDFSRAIAITSATVDVAYSTGPATANAATISVSRYFLRCIMVPNYTLKGVSFVLGEWRYEQLPDGTLRHSVNPQTGLGTPAGSVAGAIGLVTLDVWQTGNPTWDSYWPAEVGDWRGLISPPTDIPSAPFTAVKSVFRTAASPIRPGSFSVLGTMYDGTTFNVQSDTGGRINGARVKGRVDYQFGVVELWFVNPTGPAEATQDLSHLGIPGLTSMPVDLVRLNSVRYNATAYSYLPLDAEIIGIDPVRLPTDGRVPIFRPGGFAVVGHTGKLGPVTVSAGQTLNCGRVRLSRVRVVGANGAVITTGYTANLEAGTVTFSDIAGYSQPVTVEHRIEDMALVSDAQINGEIRFTRPITHAYPSGSFVSSALVVGDLQSRVSATFDQSSWDASWQDNPVGSPALASFNSALNPIVVTNKGSITERWAIVFTGSTSFQVIGEHVGVIATGGTAVNCAPLNPATGAPYFTIPAAGWGLGWSPGNVFRFNTVASTFPVWCVRTILQGPETVQDDDFTLLIRGDVNR